MEELFALIDAARRGDGGACVLVGPMGSGKTRLLDELVEHAEWRGPDHDVALTTRRGRVPASGTGAPFAAPFAALQPGLAWAGTADAPRSLIAASTVEGATAAVVDTLLAHVDTEVVNGPLLLIFDDLHDADTGTLAFLDQLVPRVASLPVALVMAARPTRISPFARWLAAQRLPIITVNPLSRDDVFDMARLFLGGYPGSRLQAVLDAAGPLPLFTTAVLESIDPSDLFADDQGLVDLTEAAASELAENAPRAVARRLDELRDESRRPLLAAAVLGDSFAPSRVMAMLGGTPGETIEALERAEHAGLLIAEGNNYRFRHDLYREAVLASASKPVLALLHDRAADACNEAGDSPLEVARHVMASDTGGERARVWLTAAAESVVAYDPAAALELAERALGQRGAPTRALELVHIRALGGVGRRADAETLTRRMLLSADDQIEQVALYRELAFSLFQQGRAAESMVEMQAAVDLAGGPLNDPDLHRRLLAETGVACLLAAQLDDAAAISERVLADPAMDLVTETCATMVLSLVRLFSNRRDDAVRLADRLEQLAGFPRLQEATQYQPLFAAALVRIDTDDLVRAQRAADEGSRRSAQAGYHWMIAAYDALRSSASFRAGDLDDAMAVGLAALDWRIDDRIGMSMWAHCIVARTALHQGNAQLADHHIGQADRLVAEGIGLLSLEQLAMAHAARREQTGEHAEALAVLGSVWDVFDTQGSFSALQELGAAIARASVRSGNLERLPGILARLDTIASQIDSPRAISDTARAKAIVTGDPALMRHALELKRQGPRRLEAAEMQAELAWLYRRAGDEELAHEVAGEARQALLACAATGDAARLDTEFDLQRQSKVDTPPVAHLSPSERRVVAMVAEGFSNSAIAEALFVSRRTVESHVSSAYRKLGVANRVELARLGMSLNTDGAHRR